VNEFLQAVDAFAQGNTIWVYGFIFIGKIMEVSLGTLRIVLINRGERTIGSLIAIVEITLWLVVVSSVLNGFRQDWIKGIVYAIAFAAGNYLGSWLDELLAVGLSSVQVVIPSPEEAVKVEEALRAKGFGVTSMDVHGMDDNHSMLMMTIQRKQLNEVIDWLETHCHGAVITVSDIKAQRHNYLKTNSRPRMMRIGK
jgi:uncharacterized protein YebE (UPF0316 family)